MLAKEIPTAAVGLFFFNAPPPPHPSPGCLCLALTLHYYITRAYSMRYLLIHTRFHYFIAVTFFSFHTRTQISSTRDGHVLSRFMYTLVIYHHHPQQKKKHYRGHSGMPTTIHMQMDKYLELIPYILPFPAASQGACICELPLPLLIYPDITIDRLYPCR